VVHDHGKPALQRHDSRQKQNSTPRFGPRDRYRTISVLENAAAIMGDLSEHNSACQF
jgi:hypothetical protein